MIFSKLALGRQVMPAISDQFAIYTLDEDPSHLTKIQDVGHIVPTPFQDPPTDDQCGYGTLCTLLMLPDIPLEIGAAGSKRYEVH